jgi:hypothetical protein
MSVPRRRLLGFLALLLFSLPIVALLPPEARPAPAPRGSTRTYRFTARVKDNGGVTPFKVGSVITGTFTYDLKAKNMYPKFRDFARYPSARNSLVFQLGDLRFTGTSGVQVSVTAYKDSAHFSIVTYDMKLPKGWEPETTRYNSYGVCLQNVPPRKVLADPGIPNRLSLPDWVNTRELRLDFGKGVRFPGGAVKGRATVHAVVESLKEP